MKEKILFEEEQSFVGTRSWYFVIVVFILTIIPMIASLLKNESSAEMIVGLSITLVVMAVIFVFFTFSKLYLTIDTKSIYYRYPPFVNKEMRLNKEDVRSADVRKYRAIWEYGGYGYRYSFNAGKAMNISGNQGLQLVLTSDKRLLIGTQKPEALVRAIGQLKENWANPNQDA